MFARKFYYSRPIFILSLLSQLLLGCDGEYPPPQFYERQVQAIEWQDAISPPPQQAAVIFGSSSIQRWETIEEDLAPVPIISRGFDGNNMNDALYYADRMIVAYNPSIIVIYEGDNDISIGISPTKFIEVFRQFVDKVRLSLPTVPIYFISIKPCPSRWEGWPLRVEANFLVQQYCEQDELLNYIDVASIMLDGSGYVREELFTEEGLHMNWEGYALWRDIIQPVLYAEYMAE